MSARGVQLDVTAGEAHWQLGITERMIQTLFRSADRLHKEDQLPYRQAVSLATKSQNQVERVRGFSPCQWALGKNPSWSDELHDEAGDNLNLAREGTP